MSTLLEDGYGWIWGRCDALSSSDRVEVILGPRELQSKVRKELFKVTVPFTMMLKKKTS